MGVGGRLGEVCSPTVPGPRGTAAPPPLLGRGKSLRRARKRLFCPEPAKE